LIFGFYTFQKDIFLFSPIFLFFFSFVVLLQKQADIFMKWWKIVTISLLLYVVVGALLFEVPRLPILNETIRNLHFHVPMWFGMVVMMSISVGYSINYLRTSSLIADTWAVEAANTGILFGVLGILTGMVWAKFTWGDYWSNDPKQNASAIALLIYFAYLLLRNSLADQGQKARIGAVYNIFAFATYIPLIFVLPRLTDSLHPGNGGNPGFNAYDLDSKLRLIFYPAVIGWILLGYWLTSSKVKLSLLSQKIMEN